MLGRPRRRAHPGPAARRRACVGRWMQSSAHQSYGSGMMRSRRSIARLSIGWSHALRLRLRQYRIFLATCWKHVGDEKKLFVAFVSISILGALTEAVGIGLFVPLLDSVSSKPNFGNIPILSRMSDTFIHIAPELRIKIVALAMLVVVAARSVLQLLIQHLGAYLPAKIEQRIRDTSFDYLLRM